MFYDDSIYIYTQLMYLFWYLLQTNYMKNQLLPQARIIAVSEELAGFLLDEVISEDGEYYKPSES